MRRLLRASSRARTTSVAARGVSCAPPAARRRRPCAAACRRCHSRHHSKASWCNCGERIPTSRRRSIATRRVAMNSPNLRPAATRSGSCGRWNISRTRSSGSPSRRRRRSSMTSRSKRSAAANSCRPTGTSPRNLQAPRWSGISMAPRRRSARSATAAAPAVTPTGRSCATASTNEAGGSWSPR